MIPFYSGQATVEVSKQSAQSIKKPSENDLFLDTASMRSSFFRLNFFFFLL